jgi:lipoyl(octanoyl) transferase
MNKTVVFQDLELIDYKKAWDDQESLFQGIIQQKIDIRNGCNSEETANYLLFCEHPHVYTLGKSGSESNLLLNEAKLAENDAHFYKINRGGDITYHGPGQLVAYPILDLDNFFTDIHKYLRLLEESVIQTLQYYGVESGRVEGMTGVWIAGDTIDARKICAMGVKSSRWVTMHGIGFNINTDLSYFNHIVPCGIEDKSVTSLQRELGRAVDLHELKTVLLEKLAEQFGFNYVNTPAKKE